MRLPETVESPVHVSPGPRAIAEVVVGSSVYRVLPYREGYELQRNSETLVIVGSASEALLRLRQLVYVLRPPAQCPVCARPVMLDQRRVLNVHNQQESAPGRRGRRCPGSGLKPAGAP